AENTFRWGALGYHRVAGGKHRLTFGGDLYRYQLNGVEQNGQRGSFQFVDNFGHSGIDNIRLGLPTSYNVTIGNLNRGFRSWMTGAFIADQWAIHPRLQLYIGLRHSM